MIKAQVGDRVVEESRRGWSPMRWLRFRTVVKVTATRLTTDTGEVWDRESGRRVPREPRSEVRDLVPGDDARAVREARRARVRSDLSAVERYSDQLTDLEVEALDTVMSQIAARLRIGVR